MKVIAKKNRELALINAQNTQNENRAETITLVVPEEYEDYNKKIVFITDDETVWDVITNNEYKITNAITKYKQVDFYIWLTKEVDGESIDFRTKTKTLNFYHNVDASDEITDEEIHGVNTVVNLLEEEIEKVENLNIEATKIGDTTTITITKKDGTTESVEINDGVDGQDGQDGQNGKDGQDGKDAKINGKNSIEIEAGNNITIDNTETGIRINSTNDGGTTDYTDLENKPKINNVELSGNKSLNDLGIQPKGNYIEDNNYVHTDNNFNNTYKNKLEGLENYDDTEVKEDIADIQDEQTEQNTEIEKLQTENARFKATLPTTTGEGQDITLDKTAEFEFIKPPLPMGNSEQVQYSGKNILATNDYGNYTINNDGTYTNAQSRLSSTYIPLESTKTDLVFSCNNVAFFFGIAFYDESKNYLSRVYANNLRYIHGSIPQSAEYARAFFSVADGSIVLDGSSFSEYELQLEYGTTPTSYEPYTNGASPNPDYPQEITNVTGDVEVKVQNKNFVNNEFSKWTLETAYAYIPINLEQGQTYTLSAKRIGELKTNYYNFAIVKDGTSYPFVGFRTIIDYSSGIPFSDYTFTVDDTWTNPKLVCYIEMSETKFNELFQNYNIQLEPSSTATPYTPHKEQVLSLTLGNIELCKIGDYQDYFYKQSNKWYLHKEIGKVVLDGSQTINKNSSDTSNYLYYINLSDHLTGGNVISNKLTIKSLGQLNGDNSINNVGISILNSNKIIYFNIGYYLSTNTVTGVSAYLTENNITIYYVLETPTDTEITDTTLISQLEAINNALSYEEQTNISSNTIALFSVEAYQDAKVILAEKGTYSKPSTGIPKTDLASAVQTSLNKADSAIQEHQDISGKANKISVVQSSASTIEINPNTFYKFGEVASLTITLASITDNTIYNEYMFEFTSGSTATTLTLPSSIKWLETPTIDANKIYQCSIVDNVGLLVGVANV